MLVGFGFFALRARVLYGMNYEFYKGRQCHVEYLPYAYGKAELDICRWAFGNIIYTDVELRFLWKLEALCLLEDREEHVY